MKERRYNDNDIRYHAAGNPSTSPETLGQLAKDEDNVIEGYERIRYNTGNAMMMPATCDNDKTQENPWQDR